MKTGKSKFFYGCTGNNTATTIDYLKFARANGADGAILAAPAYICASEADIEAYFLEVADATDLPLGIYNNPPRVKSDLHWDQLLRIFKHPNYVVHKESTTRVGQVAQCNQAVLTRVCSACVRVASQRVNGPWVATCCASTAHSPSAGKAASANQPRVL